MVNGTARLVGWFAGRGVRWLQSGFILSLRLRDDHRVSVLLTWFVFFAARSHR